MTNSQVFSAIADEMRRELLLNLAANSPKTATQLSKQYPITRQGILKHLAILENAGLVSVHQKGREKRYMLTPEPLDELNRWVKEVSEKWDKRLMRLKTLLEAEKKQQQRKRR